MVYCCKLGGKRIQHIRINNNYEFLLPETVVVFKLAIRKLIHHCTKFCGKRTQHKQAIGINNNYKLLLPEAISCDLQTCNFCFDKNLS